MCMYKDTEITIQEKYMSLKPVLNEQSRRLWAATEAKSLGHGGISIASRVTGLSRTTIHQGMKNLSDPTFHASEDEASSLFWRRSKTDYEKRPNGFNGSRIFRRAINTWRPRVPVALDL